MFQSVSAQQFSLVAGVKGGEGRAEFIERTCSLYTGSYGLKLHRRSNRKLLSIM